jgi:hypothetical protein
VPSVSEIVVVATNDFAGAEFPKLVFWDVLFGDPENVVRRYEWLGTGRQHAVPPSRRATYIVVVCSAATIPVYGRRELLSRKKHAVTAELERVVQERRPTA